MTTVVVDRFSVFLFMFGFDKSVFQFVICVFGFSFISMLRVVSCFHVNLQIECHLVFWEFLWLLFAIQSSIQSSVRVDRDLFCSVM